MLACGSLRRMLPWLFGGQTAQKGSAVQLRLRVCPPVAMPTTPVNHNSCDFGACMRANLSQARNCLFFSFLSVCLSVCLYHAQSWWRACVCVIIPLVLLLSMPLHIHKYNTFVTTHVRVHSCICMCVCVCMCPHVNDSYFNQWQCAILSKKGLLIICIMSSGEKRALKAARCC